MRYLSVKKAAKKFELSERRVQKLCEQNRIEGAEMISGVWLIPDTAKKPVDERKTMLTVSSDYITLNELCEELSISIATGKNWVKLGKLIPTYTEKKMPVFTRVYFDTLKNEITTGKNTALKSRRNKKYVSGNALYNSYVSENCKSVIELQKCLTIIENENIELTTFVIQYLIADCALKQMADRKNIMKENRSVSLIKFLQGEVSVGDRDRLIDDLIEDKDAAIDFCKKSSMLFQTNYCYENNEDILGLIYISTKNIGNRKATGSYYTSTRVVKKLVTQLNISARNKVLDPCCGTGNFLLQLPAAVDVEDIFGVDVDGISVKITRLNLALKYFDADVNIFYNNILESNYLTDEQQEGYDYIVGNPPWGYEFNDKEKKYLSMNYCSAKGKNIESYDVFVEQALKHLKRNGRLSFVLPEAILNVKTHTAIRKYIVDYTSIKYLEFLGNAFDGVQCPCIIFELQNTNQPISTMGMKVNTGTEQFEIQTQRDVTAELFSFTLLDEEYCILEKIFSMEATKNLYGNAEFALGIVTGNNKEYISAEKNDENEIILKGSDICKYHTNKADNYIVFKPESFQQIAPAHLYRAEEKLLYRFICSELVFAYDNRQTLSLNSCNIVIPKIESMNIKYVMAILNSRVAQFIYKKKYNSVKVLRAHIESIPLPIISEEKQKQIVEIVEHLITGQNLEEATKLYEQVDNVIMDLFELTEEEKQIVKKATDVGNKFLV